jgi:hypothetical protein
MNEIQMSRQHQGRSGVASREVDTRRLMRAVLLEALVSYRNGLVSKSAVRRLEACKVEAWAAARDTDSPFAFENVCEVLDIDPDSLRSRMRRLRRHAQDQRAGRRTGRRVRRSAYGA